MHNTLKIGCSEQFYILGTQEMRRVLSKVYSKNICIALIKIEKMEYKMGLETL